MTFGLLCCLQAIVFHIYSSVVVKLFGYVSPCFPVLLNVNKNAHVFIMRVTPTDVLMLVLF